MRAADRDVCRVASLAQGQAGDATGDRQAVGQVESAAEAATARLGRYGDGASGIKHTA